MASILAIVSKKIFDRDFRIGSKPATVGDLVPSTAYASTHPSLAKLADGGDLFLVTVAPGDQLLLAGVLERPTFAKDRWVAAACTRPIADITPLVAQLAFENGKGLSAKPGALAMSLQTPRTLSEADVALLRGATNVKARSKSVAKPAKAPKAPKPTTVEVVIPKGANHLARASEYLAGGALTDALDELLKAWAQHKAAEIADLVDDLGAHIARALPAIEGKKTTIDGAWRDVGDQVRPADMPRLLAAFDLATSTQMEGWLDVLHRFPLDPRLCAAAVEMSVKFVASSAGPTRTRANRLAEKIADGRCLPQIEKLIAKRSDAWNATELRDRLRRLKTKFAPPPALAKDDKPAVAVLGKTIAALAKGPAPDAATLFRARKAADDDGARLLAEVLADPSAEAPRLVYADWLQQHEDPRGELIMLQLQGAPGAKTEARIAKLVRTHGKTWLGPLAAVVSEPVFERGFLAGCKVILKSEKHRELLQHPLWATVTTVACRDPAVVESPAMKSLRTVRGLPIAQVAKLAQRKQPLAIEKLTGLTLDFSEGDRAHWDTLWSVGAFVKLHELGIHLHWRTIQEVGAELAGWKWLFEGKLGKQLTRLSITTDARGPSVANWLGAFASPALETLVLEKVNVRSTRIQRAGKQFAITYDAEERTRMQYVDWQLQHLTETFVDFPVAAAPRLDIVLKRVVKKAELPTIQEALAKGLAKQFSEVVVSQ